MKKRRLINLLITCLVTTAGFICIMAIIGIHPFGDASFLTGDLNGIYVPEYSYVKDILSGTQKWGYSFNKALGGNTTGMFAYYTSSPLLLLLAFFAKKDLVIAANVLFGIKVVYAAGFCDLFLTHRYCDDGTDILLSVCYAFMQYTFAYYQNLMWLDGVILLPLILLGLEKIFDGDSPAVYIIALAVCTWANFYIAVMCCIFIAIYFVWQYTVRFGAVVKKNILVNFTLGSIGAGLMPMAMLYPAVVQIFNSKSVGTQQAGKMGYNLLDMCRQFIVGYFDSGNLFIGMPFIYAGMVLIVGVVAYFTAQNIPAKEKLCSFTVGAIMVASFLFTPVNLLFHGMTQTVWFPHRHAFLFVLYCIILSAQSLKMGLKKHQVMAVAVFAVVMSACQLWLYRATISKKNILLSFLIIALITAILWMCKNKKLAVVCAVAVTMCELIFNSSTILKHLELYKVSDFRNQYEYMEYVKEKTDSISADGFYRTERDYFRSLNDAMLYGYNGISHFDSTKDSTVSAIKDAFGYHAVNSSTYSGADSILGDSLLNIQFTLYDRRREFSWKENIGDGIYYNKTTMPFATAVNDEKYADSTTLQGYYNNIYSNIAGYECDIAINKSQGYKDTYYEDQYFYVDAHILDMVCAGARNEDITYSVGANNIVIDCDTTGRDYILLSLGYDDGWTAKVNGEKADVVKLFDFFLAVPICDGENHIELKFTPQGARAGAAMTGFAIALSVGVILWHKRQNI